MDAKQVAVCMMLVRLFTVKSKSSIYLNLTLRLIPSLVSWYKNKIKNSKTNCKLLTEKYLMISHKKYLESISKIP